MELLTDCPELSCRLRVSPGCMVIHININHKSGYCLLFNSCSISSLTVASCLISFKLAISVDQVFGFTPWSLLSHSLNTSSQHVLGSLLNLSWIMSIIENSISRKSATFFHSDEILGIAILCRSFIFGTTNYNCNNWILKAAALVTTLFTDTPFRWISSRLDIPTCVWKFKFNIPTYVYV